MHLVADAVRARVGVPLLDILDETAGAVLAAGRRRPLLLATRYTMEHGFYGARMAGHGLEVVVPGEADRAAVHATIFDELCRGVVREDSRARMLAVVERGIAAGADSVILGCTEICLLLDPDALPCPGFDSTAVHVRAAAAFALGGGAGVQRTAA